jgi:hypothetical protein
MSRRSEDEDRADPPATLEQVRQAQDEARRILAGIPEVSGFGIERGPGGFVLRVNLTAPTDAVPETIGGVSVRTEVAGTAKNP